MIKLVEVTQSITFTPDMNVRSTKISVPWPTLVFVAVVGPLIVSGFRRDIAPVTNLYSVPEAPESDLEPMVKDVE